MGSQDKHDELWWAARHGNQELVEKLLGMEHKNGLMWNKSLAAEQAILHQFPNIFQIIIPNNAVYALGLLHRHRKHLQQTNSFHLFEDMVSKVNFAQLSNHDQQLVMTQAIELNQKQLVKSWIPSLLPSTEIAQIAEKMIDQQWFDAFELLCQWDAKQDISKMDSEEVLDIVMRRDAYEAWICVPRWREKTKRQTMFIGERILAAVWDDLPTQTKDNLGNTYTSDAIVRWLLDHNHLSQHNIKTILQDRLFHDEAEIMASLFLKMSSDTKNDFFASWDQHHNISNCAQYLQKLRQIDEGDDPNWIEQILWQEIEDLDLLTQWTTEDNVDAIRPWVERLDEERTHSLMMLAARYGSARTLMELHRADKNIPMGSVLIQSAAHGHAHVVQYLLPWIHTENDMARAAARAGSEGHLDVLKMICNARDLRAHTRILDATFKEKRCQEIEFLMDKGFSFDNNPNWARWMHYTINENDDFVIPTAAKILPHHPQHATLFGQAVRAGTYHTACALLPLFDHHLFSFPQALTQLIENGCSDLQTIQLLLNHCTPDQLIAHQLIGNSAHQNNWATMDLLTNYFDTPQAYTDAMWYSVGYKKTKLVQKYHLKGDYSMFEGSVLLEAGHQNSKELIDLLYPHFAFDEVGFVVDRLMVEIDPRQWAGNYLIQKHHDDRRRLEMERAVDGMGEDRRARLM